VLSISSNIEFILSSFSFLNVTLKKTLLILNKIFDQQRLKTDNVCVQKKSQHHLKGKKTNLNIETKQYKKKFFNLIPKKQKYPHNDSILNYNFF